ncbi:hypothetical protein IFM47457_04438 [Aspergillus lentulus]|nr:hypothetical protein IFM47457_04438 [Aspergillus lentulus]
MKEARKFDSTLIAFGFLLSPSGREKNLLICLAAEGNCGWCLSISNVAVRLRNHQWKYSNSMNF